MSPLPPEILAEIKLNEYDLEDKLDPIYNIISSKKDSPKKALI
jgi:hypothetical protein